LSESCCSFLFAQFLAIDANFHIKRKDVSSEAKDPGLGDGFSFYTPLPPYMGHVHKHWNDKQAVGNKIPPKLSSSLFSAVVVLPMMRLISRIATPGGRRRQGSALSIAPGIT
jgi:hypothetical protein